MSTHLLLKRWLGVKEIRPGAFARSIGYDRGNFHKLLQGKHLPSLSLAALIERETGGDIPATAWVEQKTAA